MNVDQRFQAASLVSILIGFALVIRELQQNRAMTQAMLASDGSIGRAHWKRTALYFDEELRALADEIQEEMGPPACFGLQTLAS